MSKKERVLSCEETHSQTLLTEPDDDLCLHTAVAVEQNYRLGFHSSTPLLTRLVIPCFILLTHAAFLYGQIEIMWHLVFEVEFIGSVEAVAWDSRLLFQVLGYSNPFKVNTTNTQILEVFTYGKLQLCGCSKH